MSTNKIKVLVADDEPNALKRVVDLVGRDDRFNVVFTAENGDEVIEGIGKFKPDVAFLDINMPGKSVFSSIPELKESPLVVFQTAYSEYAVDAFDIDAVDYLLKPVSRDRFKKALDKIVPLIKAKDSRDSSTGLISVKNGDLIKVIKVEYINRVSSEEGLSFIYSEKNRYFSDKSLNHFESILPIDKFYRISRTDIININQIKQLHSDGSGLHEVELNDNSILTISRRRVKDLKSKISTSL